MNPGQNCIACHDSMDEGPTYSAAGTIHGSTDLSAAENCTGESGLTVELLDDDGVVHRSTTNGVGNFFFEEAIAFPYTAKVIDAAGNERLMATAQSTGQCALCHTAQGAAGAPGRIRAPPP